MKRKVFQRGLLGLSLGISIGYVITIAISVFHRDGSYIPCEPSLVEAVQSEIGAVVLQAVSCGVLGAAFGAASLIWDIDSWSIAKQTGLYFLVIAATMLPIAYLTHWMEHSIAGIILYAGVFLAIFVFIWLIQYCIWKNRIQSINRRIEKQE